MTIIKVINISIVFTILLIEYNQLVNGKANFDIFAKSFKSWADQEWGTIVNPKRCRLFISKEYLGGRITCAFYLNKRIDYIINIYVQIVLFYRYGTIYRNYLINVPDLEPCELLKKKRNIRYSNPLADLLLLGIKSCCPTISRGCPVNPGWLNATNIDINATVAPFLPPVVPTGHYKIYSRFYVDGNKTIGEIEGVGLVKANFANRDKDFSMLNMG